MRFTKPKLVPTLVCLAVIGLLAAILPYPGLESPIKPIDNETPASKNPASKTIDANRSRSAQ